MSRRSLSIVGLVAAHVALAGMFAWWADAGEPTVPLALYVGVTFCQTSLLGIWGGLGSRHWIERLVGVALGIVVLAPLFSWGLWASLQGEILGLVALCTLATAGVMLLVRRVAEMRSIEASSTTSPAKSLAREGLQFSIRHLIILTSVVASLIGLGQWLGPYVGSFHSSVELVVLGLCFVTIGLGAPWATLGTGSPIVRSVIVLAIAVGAAFVPLLVDAHWPVVFWLVVMITEVGLLLLSLAVIRWCGYRLVRRGTFSPLARPTVVPSPVPPTVSQL